MRGRPRARGARRVAPPRGGCERAPAGCVDARERTRGVTHTHARVRAHTHTVSHTHTQTHTASHTHTHSHTHRRTHCHIVSPAQTHPHTRVGGNEVISNVRRAEALSARDELSRSAYSYARAAVPGSRGGRRMRECAEAVHKQLLSCRGLVCMCGCVRAWRGGAAACSSCVRRRSKGPAPLPPTRSARATFPLRHQRCRRPRGSRTGSIAVSAWRHRRERQRSLELTGRDCH